MSVSHCDVLIIGAGLSGIGAARHLQMNCPDKSFVILEARQRMGGTWDLFRYPGIRSDSDMFTLGYGFKPWTNPKSIADGPSILNYIKETATETDVDRHIHYSRKVISASWDSQAARWTVTIEKVDTGETYSRTCNFLFSACGYYDYDNPYTPDFRGRDVFQGRVVHAQHWTNDIVYRNKRVVVIGSGATAVTLVPALAKEASHTVMLQRSPSYVASIPEQDILANWMRKYLPTKWAYFLTRWKKVLFQMVFFRLARRKPHAIKKRLLEMLREELGPDYDIDTHFNPSYNPWDQRLCAVPDGDMFKSLRDGKAEVVTDHIDRFTEKGILLKSGKELEADLIVMATGLTLSFMSGIALTVDGRAINPHDHYCYRGMMFSDVPNLAQAFGYTNSSWTLKSDLTCEYMCRLLNHMDRNGFNSVTPRLDTPLEDRPFIDFSSGYVQRGAHLLPKQGAERPWRLYQNYALDIFSLRYSALDDGVLTFDSSLTISETKKAA